MLFIADILGLILVLCGTLGSDALGAEIGWERELPSRRFGDWQLDYYKYWYLDIAGVFFQR